jgi:hypothetical protein
LLPGLLGTTEGLLADVRCGRCDGVDGTVLGCDGS